MKQETKEMLEEYGCSSIKEYLEMLAEDNGVEYSTVVALYSVYGESELFDGLVCAVEDAAESGMY